MGCSVDRVLVLRFVRSCVCRGFFVRVGVRYVDYLSFLGRYNEINVINIVCFNGFFACEDLVLNFFV